MTTIEEIKAYMKEKNITYQDLSDMSNIPLNTLKNIFRGKTKNPRIDTLQAIVQALGIKEKTPPGNDLPEDVKQLVELVMELSEDEVNELSNYIDYIISKRK